MKYSKGNTLLAVIIILAVFCVVFVIPFVGLHINTGSGEQTGYVSAVEKSGVIWKTGRAYIKPTLESTQEDVYCVIDEDVYKTLEVASKMKESITLEHFSWLSAGVTNCGGEEAIIKLIK